MMLLNKLWMKIAYQVSAVDNIIFVLKKLNITLTNQV